jgi:hypothetical protein
VGRETGFVVQDPPRKKEEKITGQVKPSNVLSPATDTFFSDDIFPETKASTINRQRG